MLASKSYWNEKFNGPEAVSCDMEASLFLGASQGLRRLGDRVEPVLFVHPEVRRWMQAHVVSLGPQLSVQLVTVTQGAAVCLCKPAGTVPVVGIQ
ncbi:hypothetical protein CSUB01_12350, partial [Colletotrichum sublineola]